VKVRFTPSAEAEFLSALGHIQRDNPKAALDLLTRANAVLSRLARFPDSGRAIPEFPELPQREVIIPPYRFFYRIKGKTVWIVAVRHGAQVPEQP